VDLREAPIAKASNNGGDQLSKAECKEQCRRRTFHKEEAVGPSDENQRLRDDGDLQVNDHVQLRIVVVLLTIPAIGQMHLELPLEEGRLENDNDKHNTIKE
jgi:hypothetical protein